MTKIITKNEIIDASLCIKEGGTVVFPTETVYGLGADGLNPEAVKKIFIAKGRPSDNPLILHIADKDMLCNLVEDISPVAQKMMDKYWPGPITLIFKKSKNIIKEVCAGLDTVAVRMPSNPIARKLIHLSDTPIAAPSANLSGSPSPTVTKHVIDDLNGRVDYIIDGENCEIGLESTVVDVSGDHPVILRPGGITLEELKEIAPDTMLDDALLKEVEKPKCPGMKYTHYSPKATVTVVEGEKDNVRRYIQDKIANTSEKVGVLSYFKNSYKNAEVIDAGCDMSEYAKGLFYNLRRFDELGVSIVYAEFEETDGIGLAVKNRLYKSAGHNVIRV